MECASWSAPLKSWDGISALDCRRNIRLLADSWPTASLSLQPPLLHEGKAQYVSPNSHADSSMPSLRWRGQGLRRPPGCNEPEGRNAQRCLDGYSAGTPLEVQVEGSSGERAFHQDSRPRHRDVNSSRRPCA